MAYVVKRFIDIGHQSLKYVAETDYGVEPTSPTYLGLPLIGDGFEMHETAVVGKANAAVSGGARTTTKTLIQGIDVGGSYATPLVRSELAELFALFTRTGSPLALPSYVFQHAIRTTAGALYGEEWYGVKVATARLSGSSPGEIMLNLDLTGRKRSKTTSAISVVAHGAIDPYEYWGFGAEIDNVWWQDPESFELTINHNLKAGPYRTIDRGISHLEEGLEEISGSLTGTFLQGTLRDLVNGDTTFNLKLYFQEDLTETDGTPVFDTGALKIEVYKCRVLEHPLENNPEELVSGTVTFEAEADSTQSYAAWAATQPV